MGERKDYNESGYGFTADERRSLGAKMEAELRSIDRALRDYPRGVGSDIDKRIEKRRARIKAVLNG